MLGGPWRLTEPCDVTVGGATWLDQAQETAARTNQNAGPHRRKVGQQRAAPNQSGGGRGPFRIGEATDSCRSTQEGDGTRELAHQQRKCPHRSREEEEMQGEAWDCRQEALKQRGPPQPALGAFVICLSGLAPER